MKSYNRTVGTGLSAGVNTDILDSVIGQMSDGKWENSPSMRRYWRYATIEVRQGEVVILVDDQGYGSGWVGKTDEQVRKFFAVKIKQIAYDELNGIGWARTDVSRLDYLTRDSKNPVTVAAAYEAYDTLLGRRTATKQYGGDKGLIARLASIAAKDAEILVAQQTLARLKAQRNAL